MIADTDFAGRRVLVVGGSSGIGNESCRKSPDAGDDDVNASAARMMAADVYDVVSRSGNVTSLG